MGNQNSQEIPQQIDPCHKLACKIQTCLEKNNYQQERCKFERDSYNECVKIRTEPEWKRQQIQEKKREGPKPTN